MRWVRANQKVGVIGEEWEQRLGYESFVNPCDTYLKFHPALEKQRQDDQP